MVHPGRASLRRPSTHSSRATTPDPPRPTPRPEANTRILSFVNIFGLFVPAGVLALGVGIVAPVLPVFARSFGVGVGDAGSVFAAYQAGTVVATLPTGLLLDRFGRRRLALLGPVIGCVAALLAANAQSFPELLVFRFLGGCGQQMWLLARLAILADTGEVRQRGRLITGMLGIDATGLLLGPAVGGLLAEWLGVRAPLVVYALLALAVTGPCYWLLKDTTPTAPAAPRGGVHRLAGALRPRALAPVLTPPVLVFLVAQLLASVSRGTLVSGALQLFPAYAYEASPGEIGLIVSTAGMLGVPILFSTGALMDRFGRIRIIVPGFLLLSAAYGAMTLVAAWRLPLEAFVLTFACVQAAFNVTSGMMQVLGTDLAPAHSRGKFFAVWRLVGELGFAASPLLFARFADGWGYAYAFAFLGMTALACAGVLIGFLHSRGLQGTVSSRPTGHSALRG